MFDINATARRSNQMNQRQKRNGGLLATLKEIERDDGVDASKTKIARLREMAPEIEEAIAKKYRHKDILKALENQGLHFKSERSFEATWHRVKTERREKAVQAVPASPAIPEATAVVVTKPVSGNGNPLKALSGNRKPGDFNPVPSAKIEIDTGDK